MTCCTGLCCCSSLRGAAFFSSSVQIFAGLYLFVKWVVITFVNGVHQTYFQDSRQMILYPLLLIYLTLFILLGSISFIAVEKESGGVLKWTTRLLLLVQLTELSGHFVLGFLFPDPENDLPIHRLYHIQFILLNFLPSVFYFTIMFLYTRALLKGVYVVEEDVDVKAGLGPSDPSAPPRTPSTTELEKTPLKPPNN